MGSPHWTHCAPRSLVVRGSSSLALKFWWCIKWPLKIQKHTLKFLKKCKNKDATKKFIGKSLINANAFKFAVIIVKHATATLAHDQIDNPSKP